MLQVAARNGLLVTAQTIDVVSSGNVHVAYVVSSLRLADTTPPPQFENDLSRTFYIGVQSSEQQPLIISLQDGAATTVVVELRWCTGGAEFPTNLDPELTTNINVNVLLSGFTSDGPAPQFEDQGSFIFEDASRTCVQIYMLCIARTHSLTNTRTH